MDFVPFADFEDVQGTGIERAREPPGIEGDAVLLAGGDLGVERRYMFSPIVVGKVTEAELLQHGGPLFRPALLGVERHDAPSDQILAPKQIIRIRSRLGGNRIRFRVGDPQRCE